MHKLVGAATLAVMITRAGTISRVPVMSVGSDRSSTPWYSMTVIITVAASRSRSGDHRAAHRIYRDLLRH